MSAKFNFIRFRIADRSHQHLISRHCIYATSERFNSGTGVKRASEKVSKERIQGCHSSIQRHSAFSHLSCVNFPKIFLFLSLQNKNTQNHFFSFFSSQAFKNRSSTTTDDHHHEQNKFTYINAHFTLKLS